MKYKKNKKKNYKKLILIVVLVLFVLVTTLGITNYLSKTKIDRVLETSSYSYLPKEAKNYIKQVYEKTGEIVYTEKNKEENKAYLNPKYIKYLGLTEKQKKEVSLIPNTYVIDYFEAETDIEELPETYNLSNVNEKNYLTPFNDQGSLGLCWAFASLQQAESYLMVKNGESYSSASDRFSIRQMDYATSVDGIKNYHNENGFRDLTSGGNFYMSSLIMSYGLSMTDDKLMPYDYGTAKKQLVDILNFNKSKYEVNSTITMPIIGNESGELRKSYNNVIKENIIKYGGAYVGTGSPDGKCGFKNTDGTYAMVEAHDCVGDSGHAMQIIGWDDNYQYSYCHSGSKHLDVNDSGTCDQGTLVSDKGAWILRNSWGDDSEYKYVYFGYSSYGMDINFTTSISKREDKIWDNIYHKNIWTDGTVNTTHDTVLFNKKINTTEKVEKVKFISESVNGTYSVSIETQNHKYNNVKTVDVNYPGIYTIDLSSENIVLDDSEFKVTIDSNNETYVLANTISVFTSNVNESPVIKTETLDSNSLSINSDKNYEFITYSETKNIESDSEINYALYNGTTDYSDYIVSVENNIVAENNVNANIVISKNLPMGNYILKTIYDDYNFDSNILIPNIYELEGAGTEENPYLVYTEDDLEQIRYDLDAYYLLKNDINLTKEWVPIGTKKLPFRGGFDGGNHTITGLLINEQTDDSIGFFGYVDAKYEYDMQNPINILYREKTYIKNIIFKDAIVSNDGNAGILIGQLTMNPTTAPETAFNVRPPSMIIDSVHFIGGSVTSFEGDAGPIIGNIHITAIAWYKPYLNINNLYSSATISGFHSAGLIGYINDYRISGSGIMLDLKISNFQNVGILKQSIFDSTYIPTNNYSPVIGGAYGNFGLTLSNYIVNSIFDDVEYNANFITYKTNLLIGSYDVETSDNVEINLKNGFYITRFTRATSYWNATKVVSADEINDASLYSEWKDFDTYWKLESKDGITRIPVLKDIKYNYTNVEDITLKLYDKVSLLDYIEGKSEYQYVEFEIISNDKVISIEYVFIDPQSDRSWYDNYEMTALSKGTAKVRIINHYDGLEKEINIHVVADKVENPTITYYFSNKDDSETYTQTVDALKKFNLTKNKFINIGYKLKEWNTLPDGKGISYAEEELFENGIDENLRLYAQWETIKYTVKYDGNGGSGTMKDTIASKQYLNQISNNEFTREGYAFSGWNTRNDGTGISYANKGEIKINEELVSLIEEETIILYAQWTPITYTIKFNSNGGIGTMDDQMHIYDEEKKLSSNQYVKNGYYFNGWNSKEDGSGTTYQNEEIVKNLTNQKNTTINLYAQWEEEKYSVTFDANGGTFNDDKTTITVEDWDDSKLESLEEPTKDGYIFKGFFTEREGGTSLESYIAEAGIDKEGLIFYAQWEEELTYKIEDYIEDKDNNFIDNIDALTTKDAYKNKFKLGSKYRLELDLGTNEHVFTGSKTKLYKNDKLELEFTNIVRGDIYADGKISALDYVSIRNHIMENEIIIDEAFIRAADIDFDGKISALDYVTIRTIIMEGAN